jgi:hypothetical protein
VIFSFEQQAHRASSRQPVRTFGGRKRASASVIHRYSSSGFSLMFTVFSLLKIPPLTNLE